MKTLEELEAAHMARAQKKGQVPQEEQPTKPQGNASDEDAPEYDEQPYDDDEQEHDEPLTNAELEAAQNRVAELEQQMSALKNRLAPAQRASEDFRHLYQTEQQRREEESRKLQEQITSLQSRLEEQQSKVDVAELLTEDERMMFDPEQLSAITKIAQTIAKRAAPKVDVEAETLRVLRERDERQVREYRKAFYNDPHRGLADLTQIASQPKFREWLEDEENDAGEFDMLANAFMAAGTTREIDRIGKALARRVARYKEHTRGKGQKKTAEPSTQAPRRQRKPPSADPQKVQETLAEAKRLARSRNPKDRAKAKEIIDQLG